MNCALNTGDVKPPQCRHDQNDPFGQGIKFAFGELVYSHPVCDFCWHCDDAGNYLCEEPAIHVEQTSNGPLFTCDIC